jgi:hypothetical protein
MGKVRQSRQFRRAEGAPKQIRSAYICFSQAVRNAVKASMPTGTSVRPALSVAFHTTHFFP